MIHIAPSSVGGNGVFASRDIHQGELVDSSFVHLLGEGDSLLLNSSFLKDYLLHFPGFPGTPGASDQEAVCLAGFALMFNHSDTPNVGRTYKHQVGTGEFIEHVALVDIPAETELFVKYACEIWWDKKPTRPAHKGYYK